MSDPVCRCGHPRSRHFSGSMVRGHHACLVKDCECRCYEDHLVRGSVVKQRAVTTKLTPEQQAARNKDLL